VDVYAPDAWDLQWTFMPLTQADSWTGFRGKGASHRRSTAGGPVGRCEDTAVVDGSGNGSVRSDGNRRGQRRQNSKGYRGMSCHAVVVPPTPRRRLTGRTRRCAAPRRALSRAPRPRPARRMRIMGTARCAGASREPTGVPAGG
jgi:hypothetical protein